ncbi:unnamed protein product [Wuchereria bancrofti]|uniref:Uncharacterized protein n=1 Tax=Wuchereria bancrofti TaxID=6293 RepID=A0A3P7GDR2_WUCBA|nr:unnamed protein product [Wuchereria bancrofti]
MNAMPIVSRTTVTTTRTTGFRSSTIPVWIIALVVILLVYLQDKGVRASYSTTYIIIALTCGLLLGWSIGSVLQQIFFIRTVEIDVEEVLPSFLWAKADCRISFMLAICSLIVAVSFLLERSDWSRYESYRLMIGTAICFLIQSVVCIMMLSWAFYGNLVIVESR